MHIWRNYCLFCANKVASEIIEKIYSLVNYATLGLAFVCDLKALNMKEIVSFSTVTLARCGSQYSALLWVETHLPLGFPVLQSR